MTSYVLTLTAYLLIRLRKYDLVSVHLAYFQADAAALIGRLSQRPIWVKIAASGAFGEIQRMKRLIPFTPLIGIRWATRVQATSLEIAAECIDYGVPRSHIVHIPNGVDTITFRPARNDEKLRNREALGILPDSLVVLFVGRLANHKGIPQLLQAWSIVNSPGATLVLLGSPTTMDASPIAPTAGVLVRSWTNDPLSYYQAADAFVLPSLAEGMSNALLEAMACGLPVITSNSGASAEMIESGIDGMVVERNDVASLVAALRSILSSSDLRLRLGSAAVETVRARFSITKVVDQLESCFKELN